jgi:hypothetical protein
MNLIGRATRKRYYEEPCLSRCPAVVVVDLASYRFAADET